MGRRVITRAIGAAAIILFGLAALTAFAGLAVAPRLSAAIASRASEFLGRAVHLSSASVVVFPRLAVRLKGLDVAEDPRFGPAPFLTLVHGDVRVRLRPLLHGQIEIDSVVLHQPRIRVIQNKDGQTNLTSLGKTEPPGSQTPPRDGEGTATTAARPGMRVQIDAGVITYINQGADDAPSNYDLEDLTLALTAGSTLAFEGKGRLQPGDVGVEITDGTVALNGVSQWSDAPLRARVTLEARDLTDLFAVVVGPAPAINGGIKGTLAVAGTLANPTASGDLVMPGVALTRTSLQCPAPHRRTLMFPTLRVSAAWEGIFIGRPAMAELGDGTITANLMVRFDPAVRLELGDVAITALPLERILVDFFCQGYAVTGPLDLTGVLSLDADRAAATLSSVGQLRIGPGQVVGPQALALLGGIVRVGGALSALLSADLPWSLFSSPLDFDSITATYQVAHGVLSIRDLVYLSHAMKISGTGEYELATERLNLEMVVNHGRGEVYAKITGTADSPSIHVRPSTILRNVDPGKIGHGVQDLFHRLF